MTHLGDLLSAYLDGELEPDEHNRLVSHLDVCGRVAMTSVTSITLVLL